jgi:wobble nucleotide-excising tRNase
MAIEAKRGDSYDWVKFVYIDDPISSLDEHNSIAVASDLAGLLKKVSNDVKVIISTHHGLFFNVMFNELKGKRALKGVSREIKRKAYILHRNHGSVIYSLRDTRESPFLHHVAALNELQMASKNGEVTQYHFNTLRSILEKTAIFFGRQHFSTCFEGHPNKEFYVRFLNVRSHSKYSVFEPDDFDPSEKKRFREILTAFLKSYPFSSDLFTSLPVAAALPAQPQEP